MPTREEALAELTGPGGPFEISLVPVRGVPLRVFASAPDSLRDLWLASAAHGESPYLVYGDEVFSYAESHRIVRSFAAWLTEHGVRQGDRVAIGMRNYPEWALAFWAIQSIGAISVSLNAWWTSEELKYALEDSATRLVVVDQERLDRLGDDLLSSIGIKDAVVVRGPGRPGVTQWSDATGGSDAALPSIDIHPDDDATILYTSGTTGFPKGAVGSNRNHVTNVWNTVFRGALNSALSSSGRRPRQQVSLWTFPFFHIAGVTGVTVAVAGGGTLVTQYKWDAKEALQLVEQHRVTQVAGVPTVVRGLMEHPDYSQHDLSSLSTISQGGSPVPPDSIARIESDFSGKVGATNGYGLTETTSTVVTNAGRDYFAKKNSVGQPTIGTDVRIVAEDGSETPLGSVGEIWIQSPSVVRGYWNKPEETEKAFPNGWFRTGDAGYLDKDGFLYVADRIKDMVIRGGENVYCAEVEAAIFEHPAIADCAVFGVPHPTLGEEVAVALIAQPGFDESATPDLTAHLKVKLASFKVPSKMFWRTEPLPRNATGKVLKKELREAYSQA
jgi:long-chain acyl-CoA synthetase